MLAESRTVLFNSNSPAEFALQAGKVHNLRLAARAFDGLVIPAGKIFSFWTNLGRANRRRGFVNGRELREGCVIPNIGGGLCQLSNALCDVALRGGCEIVERHAHSRHVPGTTTRPGRDATIFWNYVDLRFRPPVDCRLRVALSRGELMVALESGAGPTAAVPTSGSAAACETRVETVESCETCGVTKCFRNPAATSLPRRGITAWLLDRFEPEFDDWIQSNHSAEDELFLPLKTPQLTSYRWTTNGFATIRAARLTAVRRSVRSRRLAAQGAERQRELLHFDRELALSYAQSLSHLADHLVISQNLLPHLWRYGALGGRTFDVLMTRLPIDQLERTLDAAANAHPESKTLSDFRALPEIREAEQEALAAARHWVTPHSFIADLGLDHVVKIEWRLPPATARHNRSRSILFPASTLGRKGCYEIREVLRGQNLPLLLGGPILEAPDFWRRTNVRPAPQNWIAETSLLILPAWVEHWPRRLLAAAAAGIPVIASPACGLRGVSHVTEIPSGDAEALGGAIAEHFERIRA